MIVWAISITAFFNRSPKDCIKYKIVDYVE